MDSTYTIRHRDGHRAIQTTVTSRGYTVKNWITAVEYDYQFKHTVVVGLDVEWRPNRHPAENNPAATLQLCVGHRCLIIQLLYMDYFPRALRRFLSGDKYVFAGVGVGADAAKLEEEYGLVCGSWYDVQEEVMEWWPERFRQWPPGLGEIAVEVAEVEVEKPWWVRLSDWEREVLSGDQIMYACLDAYASCWSGVMLFFGFYE